MTESEHVVSRFDLAELTDNRAAKIEAMAEAIQGSWPGIIKAWEEGTGDPYTLDNLDELDAMDMATAALGALQLWSLDALLDSVHPDCGVHVWLEAEPEPENGIMGAHYMATLYLNRDTSVFGDGTTRMDALRNAVAQATTTQEGTSDE